ncbi:MAG: DUF1287 domain-containing protein [Acidobacteria bacterium]|nr:DUF1287 domain-containing protein [Acidobacteriota bacterium]
MDGATSAEANGRAIAVESPSVKKIIEAAIGQTRITRSYDPAYVKLDYPMGDVPMETGVCSDVVIRAFRQVGIDLQQTVHEDMAKNFAAYPNKWGLKRPDTNIDHRRVPNLMMWLKRQGKAVSITANAKDYWPGDIVAWDLGGGITHIGLMTNRLSDDDKTFQVVHNIGAGARLENVLFNWKIIGHYRYF